MFFRQSPTSFVLFGLILSFPKLAEEIEDTPKYRKGLAAVCILLGLVGVGFEVSQRHRTDIETRQLLTDVGKSLKNTDDLVQKTTTMVTVLDLLGPQVAAVNDRLGSLDTKIDKAKKQNNTELVAALQSQKQVELSRLLALAPGIVSEMQSWAKKWDNDDGEIYYRSTVQTPKLNPLSAAGQLERAKIVSDALDKRANLAKQYTNQVLPLLQTADSLRTQLLNGLQETAEDKRNAAIFDKALGGEPITFGEMNQITSYRQGLSPKEPVRRKFRSETQWSYQWKSC